MSFQLIVGGQIRKVKAAWVRQLNPDGKEDIIKLGFVGLQRTHESLPALLSASQTFPHTVGNHPLRGRWPEGPDEVASNGKLS